MRLFLGCVLLSVVMTSPALPHGGATGVVKDRMDAMQAMRKDIKELRHILGSEGLDLSRGAEAAKRISDKALTMPVLFPKDSNPPPSEALPRIWSEWRQFESQFSDLSKHARQLADVVGDQDRQAAAIALKRVQSGCQMCHDRYQVQD